MIMTEETEACVEETLFCCHSAYWPLVTTQLRPDIIIILSHFSESNEIKF